MPASYTDVETKMQRSRAHLRETSTNLPQFQPQCSALLGAHRSVLSKHLHTPLQIVLCHAAELSRCPRRRKGSSDVSTARHRRCSNTPQRIGIKRDQLTRKSGHTNVQRWKSQRAHSTSRPPALSIDNSPNETLTLLSQKTLVHTLTNASPAHRAVLPLFLSQQYQLHGVLIQHHLHGRKTARMRTLNVTKFLFVYFDAYQRNWINVLGWEGKHQPAQMFHITNLPFRWLPGKQVQLSSWCFFEINASQRRQSPSTSMKLHDNAELRHQFMEFSFDFNDVYFTFSWHGCKHSWEAPQKSAQAGHTDSTPELTAFSPFFISCRWREAFYMKYKDWICIFFVDPQGFLQQLPFKASKFYDYEAN